MKTIICPVTPDNHKIKGRRKNNNSIEESIICPEAAALAATFEIHRSS
jgi:hypothetical protein